MPSSNGNRILSRAHDDLASYAAAVWPRFECAPHHRRLCDELEAVESGDTDRLQVAEPPRHGKSLLTSAIFPAWCLGRNPQWSIITASYGAELTHDFGRMVRGFIDSDIHRAIFRNSRITEDNAAAHRLGLHGGGAYYAAGVGGPITGRGSNLLVIDDPQKNAEDAYSPIARRSLQAWYEQVAYTRLAPGGRIVLISTRWHLDDLAGYLLKQHATDNWKVLSLPAIAEPCDELGRAEGEALWPSKFPVEALQRIRAQIGSVAWSALYQQRPVAVEGAVFRKEWLRSFVPHPNKDFSRLIFSLDTAFKTGESNDYSVISVWGESTTGYYLIDLVRERLDFPSLKSRVVAKAAWFRPHAVLIEDAASGQSLIQSLKIETSLPILPVKPLGDKESRASAVSPLFESGRVFLPESAPWLADFIDELLSFPVGGHDDQVDATTQALTWLRGERREYAYTPVSQYLSNGRYPLTYPTPKIEPTGEEVAAMEDGFGRVRWGVGRLRFGKGAW